MITDFISLLFPNYCFACNGSLVKGETYMCTCCISELPKTNFHKDNHNPLAIKFYGIVQIKYAFAYLKFLKNGKVQNLLHKLKYENFPELGTLLGRWYGLDLINEGMQNEFDIITTVPLHKARLRKRGYNQSDGFAQGLAESLGVPWSGEILSKEKMRDSQTNKSRLERFTNVSNIFDVKEKALIEGKRVLLVDDVITTGATLSSCSSSLLQHCKDVSVAAIAVA